MHFCEGFEDDTMSPCFAQSQPASLLITETFYITVMKGNEILSWTTLYYAAFGYVGRNMITRFIRLSAKCGDL